MTDKVFDPNTDSSWALGLFSEILTRMELVTRRADEISRLESSLGVRVIRQSVLEEISDDIASNHTLWILVSHIKELDEKLMMTNFFEVDCQELSLVLKKSSSEMAHQVNMPNPRVTDWLSAKLSGLTELVPLVSCMQFKALGAHHVAIIQVIFF